MLLGSSLHTSDMSYKGIKAIIKVAGHLARTFAWSLMLETVKRERSKLSKGDGEIQAKSQSGVGLGVFNSSEDLASLLTRYLR